MAPTPGILYVTMAPKPSLAPAQFHDWYQNEHGPGRLRLPQIFPNGFRYKATDGEEPEWMAVYDVKDTEDLTKEVYTSLRLDPKQSQRERDTMKQIKVNRKFYDLLYEKKGEEFVELEGVEYEGKAANVVVAVLLRLHDQLRAEGLGQWMEEEHIAALSKVPGFRRARRFVTSHVEPAQDPNETEYLTLYEYSPETDLGNPQMKGAVDTPWGNDIFEKTIKGTQRRAYSLAYTFGPAPRDLHSLADPSASPWSSDFHRARTIPTSKSGEWPALESYITTSDGAVLPYRLEGATNVNAPLIVLDNCVLAEYGIWNNLVKIFLSKPENKQYRILRFNKRGRTSSVGTTPITIDLLAADIIALLDALRVPKAALVVGCSLGGATSLNVALKYPTRVEKFISSDTNASTPASNPGAWDERVAIATKESATSASGESIVGEKLAEVTTRRWFVAESYEDPVLAKEAERVKQMVKSNSLEGFRKGVKALYAYDMREAMKTATVPGAFVVGGGDGALPKGMKKMNEDYAGKSEFFEIPNAGHLPMVEKPKEFAEIVEKVLRSS